MTHSESSHSHSTAFYLWIWVALLAMLGISLGIGLTGHSNLATGLIFILATIKAFLVASYYMGLSLEPRYIKITMISALLFMGILFIGLVPDIVIVYGRP